MTKNKSKTCMWTDFKWLNEPDDWSLKDDVLQISTNSESDFWQETYYKFQRNTGHVYGKDVGDNFTMQVCVEGNFEKLYDQAGVMIYTDDRHWLKAGIEYNDGQPMIGSVLTNKMSDWATGVFKGDPNKFWLRLTKVNGVVCVKYSTDNTAWNLLRLCPFPNSDKYFVGVMCCSPKRRGLKIKFSDVTFTQPGEDILHSN
ncbi:uncharacterized protein [Battus philenor]|uniref:uncharacterized protein n=1 Tax=Battus philenor TaxID=42288 RepID=UPI0035D0B8DA